MSQAKVRKNEVTGRFEKNPAAKQEDIREELIQKADEEQEKTPIAEVINDKAQDLFETVVSLERSFYFMGLIHNSPLAEYLHAEDECDASDVPQPADPCPYYPISQAIISRRNMFLCEDVRPMSVVRDQAMNAVAALNYVLARAQYGMDGDSTNAGAIEEFAIKVTEGYAGFNETESVFNQATANAVNIISWLNSNFFGELTEESDEENVMGSLQNNLRDHLVNVSDTLSTVASQARALHRGLKRNLL